MGMEGAGIVVAAGAKVPPEIVGARVLVVSKGTFAERMLAPAARIVLLPDGMDFDVAAGFAIAYGTAHGALHREGRLQPGERLLVLGAAGAGGADKLAIAQAHGADHLIDYRSGDLRARLREICAGGPDMVFDPVGGDMFEPVLRQMNWGGRIVIIGFAGGAVPQIPANILLVKNVAALGFNFGSWLRNRPDAVRESMATLFGWWRDGKLRPLVSARYDLAEAATALAELRDRRATGKIVLTTGSPSGRSAR
jgi:NADPH2:quinone reductase